MQVSVYLQNCVRHGNSEVSTVLFTTVLYFTYEYVIAFQTSQSACN